MESNVLQNALLAWVCLFVFNIKKYIFLANLKPFHTRGEKNKHQAEESVHSRL